MFDDEKSIDGRDRATRVQSRRERGDTRYRADLALLKSPDCAKERKKCASFIQMIFSHFLDFVLLVSLENICE